MSRVSDQNWTTTYRWSGVDGQGLRASGMSLAAGAGCLQLEPPTGMIGRPGWRPVRMRSEMNQSEKEAASPLELFFDLVLVFALSQLSPLASRQGPAPCRR
jgi:hypothetical protein